MLMSDTLAEALTSVAHNHRVSFSPPSPSHPADFDINLFQLGDKSRVQGWVRATIKGWVLRIRDDYRDTVAARSTEGCLYPTADEALMALDEALMAVRHEVGESIYKGEEV